MKLNLPLLYLAVAGGSTRTDCETPRAGRTCLTRDYDRHQNFWCDTCVSVAAVKELRKLRRRIDDGRGNAYNLQYEPEPALAPPPAVRLSCSDFRFATGDDAPCCNSCHEDKDNGTDYGAFQHVLKRPSAEEEVDPATYLTDICCTVDRAVGAILEGRNSAAADEVWDHAIRTSARRSSLDDQPEEA